MSNFFDEESSDYLVLVNDEGQYSLWRSSREIPPGWTAVGPVGSRGECLAYIDAHWVDMRPRSIIKQIKVTGNAVSSTTA